MLRAGFLQEQRAEFAVYVSVLDSSMGEDRVNFFSGCARIDIRRRQ